MGFALMAPRDEGRRILEGEFPACHIGAQMDLAHLEREG